MTDIATISVRDAKPIVIPSNDSFPKKEATVTPNEIPVPNAAKMIRIITTLPF